MWPPPQWGPRGGGPNGQIVNVKKAADGRRQRSRKIIDEEREKYRAKNGSLRNTSTDSKGAAFVILKNHRSAPVRKERLSPTSKARREASRNKLVEKGGVPDRVKSFREIDSRLQSTADQQPPQRGGAVPGPVWVGLKWLLAFPRVPVTPGTPHSVIRLQSQLGLYTVIMRLLQ